ncbi:transketolase [Candidatus Aerophobetes bacterium]|uniref:Transketolase n=1 Tax=Aerophobetes bacterium TaxID=2030807 RepID=A0A2A4Y8T1_UNCAE|nr:MAG: transketolase [Candidatus Aerophobetes bacterium]
MLDTRFKSFSRRVRLETLEMIQRSKSSHIGACLSLVDILSVLYLGILKIFPNDALNPNRDRCIISKGHAAAAVYATLAEIGYFNKNELATYCRNGSYLTGHLNHKVPGVDFSTGSLGHGLSVGCGIAILEKRENQGFNTFVISSDGDLNEGSTWEGIMFAAHHKLSNLIMIVDYNRSQALGNSDKIINLETLESKFKAFNWLVKVVDGHNHISIYNALISCKKCKECKPKVLIANTIKGKGITFMENELLWHYKNPIGEHYHKAKKELEFDLCEQQ